MAYDTEKLVCDIMYRSSYLYRHGWSPFLDLVTMRHQILCLSRHLASQHIVVVMPCVIDISCSVYSNASFSCFRLPFSLGLNLY
jgi:hypothetical protein